jgi:hypothetical protein
MFSANHFYHFRHSKQKDMYVSIDEVQKKLAISVQLVPVIPVELCQWMGLKVCDALDFISVQTMPICDRDQMGGCTNKDKCIQSGYSARSKVPDYTTTVTNLKRLSQKMNFSIGRA